MKKFIENISTVVPHTKERIDINLKGKNLIITGRNGSGKTSLVTRIYGKLNDFIRLNNFNKLKLLEEEKELLVNQIRFFPEENLQLGKIKEKLKKIGKEIEKINSDPKIVINDCLDFNKKVNDKLGVIEFFNAVRQSQIQDARSASGINYNRDALNQNSEIGNQLEQHLVNLYTRRSFAVTENKNPELAVEITKWLSSFDENLKFLMEDDSVHLEFDADNFKFYIHQDGKIPYTFQNLSSGYASIFSVFSRLLMHSEYLKVSPSKLCGVAIIDELDAHLHVTLQRKILPFLSDSFPGIQYIVTTHSPFVLTSVSNAEIYDISRREQVGDLSSYSYESVLEGLFGVSSVSDILQNKIRDMASKIDSEEINLIDLQKLVEDIEINKDVLDEESKFYLNSAKLKIIKIKKGVNE